MTIISRVLSVGKDQPTIMTYLNATLTPYISRLSHLKDLMVRDWISYHKKQISFQMYYEVDGFQINLQLNTEFFQLHQQPVSVYQLLFIVLVVFFPFLLYISYDWSSS